MSDISSDIDTNFDDLGTGLDKNFIDLHGGIDNVADNIVTFKDGLTLTIEEAQRQNNYYNDYSNLQEEQNKYTDKDAASTINNGVNDVKGKFGFYGDIQNNVNDMVNVITNTSSAPTFSVNVKSKYYTGSVKVLDLSWYADYKDFGDKVICIFCYLSFLWNIFLRLPDIIAGGGASSYVANQFEDIRAYKATGFGRISNLNRR